MMHPLVAYLYDRYSDNVAKLPRVSTFETGANYKALSTLAIELFLDEHGDNKCAEFDNYEIWLVRMACKKLSEDYIAFAEFCDDEWSNVNSEEEDDL